MQIPKQSADAYAAAVDSQADEAARRMRASLSTLDFSGGYEERKAARDEAMESFKELVSVYGDAAATLAADFYEELAESAGEQSVESSVRYAARNLFGQQASAAAFADAMDAALRRYVKKMANDTVSRNAVRDGARHGVKFARVPTGAETCAFCIMLASRGFVYASEKTAGEFDHFHDNCDCKVVAGFGPRAVRRIRPREGGGYRQLDEARPVPADQG